MARRRPRRRARRSSGSSAARRPRAALAAEVELEPATAGRPLRPRRLPARRRRLPAHPSRARDPLAPARRARRSSARRRAERRTARARPGSRAPRPVLAAASATRTPAFVRVLVLPRRVGGQADDPLRRPGRRGQAEAPARDGLPGGAARAVRTGGRILVDQLELHGADLAFCLPGRELPARARRALRLADPARHLPPRGGRRERGRGLRQADRPARASASSRAGPARRRRRSACTPRARTRRRCSCWSARCRARSAGREALQEIDYAQSFGGIAKSAWQRRPRRPHPRARGARVLARALGPARPGRARAARGRARRGGGRRRTRRRVAAAHARAARRGPRARCASSSPAPSGRSSSWARAAGRARRPTTCSPSARRTSCPVACAFRCQDFVDNRSRSLRRRARRRDGPARSRRGCARPISSLALGGRLGEVPTRRYTLLDVPQPRQTLVHVHPDPEELGRVYEPELGDRRGLPELAAALRAARSGRAALARVDERGARRLRGEPAARADGGAGRPRRDHGVPARAAARRRDPDERRRQLHRLGAPLLRVHAVRDAARARAAARWATACRRRSRRKLVHPDRIVALLRRRRRLPDELAGARDRRAVRAADRRARRQQRHVRDDPHAPGAALPGPRDRHRSRATRTSPRSRGPTARTASGSSGRRTSRRPSSARSPPAGRRCSSCASTPSRSARAPRSASCERGPR